MTARAIRLLGDPILRTQCDPVTRFDAELRALVTDLMDTLFGAEGRAGVAAPQIGVDARVFAYHANGEVGHLVNPSLVVAEGAQDGDEGCLSLPGLYFPTPRASRVTAHGFDQHGEPIVVEAEGFLARALQHESDHLDGVLYVDTLRGTTRRQALRAIRSAWWAAPTS
ncbi:MAG TPA: peptide deformylase [Micromonosporaceae bacterium]|nr:peptide deformylase [Micromonosporaceae bacterium]